jgi:hypothetical protein
MTIPLKDSYPLTTLVSQIRILDTSSPSLELACIDISTTPFYKHYFAYTLFLWFPVALLITWALIMFIARAWAAHTTSVLNKEAELASSLTARLSPRSLREELGPVFWDTASGASLQASAALRRFATPCTREVMWAIQFAVMLSLVAVEWPEFACEFSLFLRPIVKMEPVPCRSYLLESWLVHASLQRYDSTK